MSDFEKALARAAAERNARDEAEMKIRRKAEREATERFDLIHSIVDPYLADLGPKAFSVLRDLGVPKERTLDRGDRFVDEDYWSFWYYDAYRVKHRFSLHENGEFAVRFWGDRGLPINFGLIENRNQWVDEDTNGMNEDRVSKIMANLEDRKVYIICRNPETEPTLQELSEYLAQATYSKKPKV